MDVHGLLQSNYIVDFVGLAAHRRQSQLCSATLDVLVTLIPPLLCTVLSDSTAIRLTRAGSKKRIGLPGRAGLCVTAMRTECCHHIFELNAPTKTRLTVASRREASAAGATGDTESPWRDQGPRSPEARIATNQRFYRRFLGDGAVDS